MVVRHAITFTKHWVPTNEPSQAIYPVCHTLKQIHFPLSILSMPRVASNAVCSARCQYTPTQYITLYRLPWLLTRARIHSLHWLVVWVKSWFSFYHELNRLFLYISTIIIICLYMYVILCAMHKNIYCKRSIHYSFQDKHMSLSMRNKNEMS